MGLPLNPECLARFVAFQSSRQVEGVPRQVCYVAVESIIILDGRFSFFDHPEGEYTNRSIAQHPGVMNLPRMDMESLSCGYSLRLTTFNIQLKGSLKNNGVIISGM